LQGGDVCRKKNPFFPKTQRSTPAREFSGTLWEGGGGGTDMRFPVGQSLEGNKSIRQLGGKGDRWGPAGRISGGQHFGPRPSVKQLGSGGRTRLSTREVLPPTSFGKKNGPRKRFFFRGGRFTPDRFRLTKGHGGGVSGAPGGGAPPKARAAVRRGKNGFVDGIFFGSSSQV